MAQPSLLYLPPDGFFHLRGFFSQSDQERAAADCRELCRSMPLYTPRNAYSAFKLQINSFGKYGWHSDAWGYRYITEHPHGYCRQCGKWQETSQCSECQGELIKKSFPAIPGWLEEKMLDAAAEAGACLRLETVLLNYYEAGSGRLGKHRDSTEDAKTPPIVTVSLGDDALFGIGGQTYEEPCQYILVESGDCIVMSKTARTLYHEVKEVIPGTSKLLKKPGRISLTGRQVKL
jgi:alkylated DNA repair protein (DNA oxidative demethylase)